MALKLFIPVSFFPVFMEKMKAGQMINLFKVNFPKSIILHHSFHRYQIKVESCWGGGSKLKEDA